MNAKGVLCITGGIIRCATRGNMNEDRIKIKELCSSSGEGYSEADFRHGPFALIDPGFPVIVVAPSGKALPTLTEFVAKLAERQAETLERIWERVT